MPKFRALTKLLNLDIQLNRASYQNLLKMGNCFTVPETQNLLKEEREVEKAKEKSEVMKNSRKIGMIYLKDLTGNWKKYIAVYSGNFIYFYANKKDTNYSDYMFTKSATVTTIDEAVAL